MFFDSTMVLLIPVLVFAFYAQHKVRSTYDKFLRVRSDRGITGVQAARRLLDSAGLQEVPINTTAGTLTDHYDPRKRALFLSESNYNGTSLSALGVACHEAGHALQHARRYWPLQVRQAIWPVAGFGGNLALPLFFMGFLFQLPILMDIGIAVFAVAAFFAIVTLPVEFDASNRAIRLLSHHGIVTEQERGQVRQVLNAAALTYVAGALMAVMQLVRMLILRDRR
ncbi:MAG: zinc metallopeptidase [Candidatus Krumholzibacteriia bacterium]